MRIEKYAARWHEAVIALGNEVFGPGYFSEPWESATEPGAAMFIAADGDRQLLGFTHGRVLPQGGLDAFLEGKVRDIPADIAEADAKGVLGAIQAVAVAPAHRRRGVGVKLLTAVHDTLVGEGADKLIVAFKRGPTATPVDALMHKLGFDLWTRVPSYWQAKCDGGEFRCVDRHDRCACTAVLYRKPVY